MCHGPWSVVELTKVALSSELVAFGLCDSCDAACYTVCVAAQVLRFPVVTLCYDITRLVLAGLRKNVQPAWTNESA